MKVIQVAMDQGRLVAVCEDGTMWAGTWGMRSSVSWERIPSLPDAPDKYRDVLVGPKNYEPKGTVFMDRGREMMLVADDDPRESLRGWLVYRHPDGQWVTLRVATQADRDAVWTARR